MKKSLKVWLLFLVLLTGLLPLTALAKEDGREKLNFNQGWKFVRDNIQEAIQVDYPMEELERWESVDLPHTVRVEPYNNSGGINYQGEAMYRKHFKLSEDYEGKKIFIEFEGVMGVTDVWVNGEHLQGKMAAKTGENTQYGGYLPFILDVTDVVHCDGEYNVITVLTDNSDNETVPPGKPQSQLDFTYFGGIYRNVWLEVTDQVHITNAVYEDIVAGGGILVEYPQVSKESATVSVQTHVRNEGDTEQEVTLKTELADEKGNIVQTQSVSYAISGEGDHTFQQELVVTDPNLWNLDTPYLYKLVSTVLVDGKELDREETKIGIRKITMSPETGLLINGEPAGYLSGVNRHQEYPYVGYAASSDMQRRDAIKFKSAGFNIVRTSHSVQSIDFIEACDELGILVMECVPGWQHWSDDWRFAERVKNDIRQMVRRTRNHPSILCYEISLNESSGMPDNFTNECNDVAKEEHPDVFTSAENPRAGANSDILYGTPTEVAEWSDTAMALIREYGDDWVEQSGKFDNLTRVTRGPGTFYPGGEGAMVKHAQNRLFKGYTFPGTGGISLSEGIQNYVTSNKRFIGATMWIGIDHNRGYHETMSPCGLWDLRRIPKYSYYAFESQRSLEENEYLEARGVETGASIFIASSWGEEAPKVDKLNETIGTDGSRSIDVYSNADRVRLSVISETGETLWTATQEPTGEGTASYLDHPPFVFENVPYAEGSYLKAEGLDGDGVCIMKDEQHTAGEPAKLKLEADLCGLGLTADGSDQVMVYAYVLDENGNVCQEADNKLYFSVEGEASIIGDGDRRVGANPIEAEAGITGILLQSTKTAGEVKIKVQAEGLEEHEITIETAPMTQKAVEYEEIAQGPSMEYRSMYLTEKEEILEGNDIPSIIKGDVTLGDTTYENSIQVKNMMRISYDLAGNYSRFTATGALEDASKSPNGAIFKVYTDGTLRYVSEPVTNGVADIDLDVSGCETLTLVAEDVSSINTGKMLWLSPYIYEGTTPEDESELKENLALGKQAEATSTDEGTSPQEAVDGNSTSLWRSREAVREGAPQSWTVDLGEAVDIRNARLAVEHDYLRCHYRIYTSADKKQWELRAQGAKTAHGNALEDVFTATGVRYVKVEFYQVESTQGEEGGREPKASIQEFEVYPDKGVETVRDYNLKGIQIAGKDFAFSPKKTEYEIVAEEHEREFYVRAIPANARSTVRINGEEIPGALGTSLEDAAFHATALNENQEIVAEVTSPDGKGKKTYTFRFVKKGGDEVYDAAKAFVPGINGANQWSYQALDKSNGSMEDLSDEHFTCVQGEYAWGAEEEWLYSGPRYMHPREELSAVRTFTAPKDGVVRYEARIEKFDGQPGQVSFALWKDGSRIWPEEESQAVVNSGDVLKINVQIPVNEGEKLQLVMDSYGDNGVDATGVLTTVTYPEYPLSEIRDGCYALSGEPGLLTAQGVRNHDQVTAEPYDEDRITGAVWREEALEDGRIGLQSVQYPSKCVDLNDRSGRENGLVQVWSGDPWGGDHRKFRLIREGDYWRIQTILREIGDGGWSGEDKVFADLDGTVVYQTAAAGNDAQLWKRIETENGTVYENKGSGRLLYLSQDADGTALTTVSREYLALEEQIWQLEFLPVRQAFKITSVCSGRALTAGEEGLEVAVYEEGDGQLWQVAPDGLRSLSGYEALGFAPCESREAQIRRLPDALEIAAPEDVLKVGEEMTLTVACAPSDATEKEVEWKVASGTGSAQISKDGVLIGQAPGTVTVTAASALDEGIADSITLTVEGEEIRMFAAADTGVQSWGGPDGERTENYGGSKYIRIISDVSGSNGLYGEDASDLVYEDDIKIGFLKFPVDYLKDKKIKSAVLQLTYFGKISGSKSGEDSLAVMPTETSDWEEGSGDQNGTRGGGMTWDTRPGFGEKRLRAYSDSFDLGEAYNADDIWINGTRVTIDVTEILKALPEDEEFLSLGLFETVGADIAFVSKEGARLIGDLSLQPTLMIEAEETSDQEAADQVERLIEAIGDVRYTQESQEKIQAAREAYEKLTQEQKAFVDNYDKLTEAEEIYGNLEAAEGVKELIEAIGDVKYTQESREKIQAAREAYEKLTQEQKAFVNNYEVLTQAEETYGNLEASEEVKELIHAIGDVAYTQESEGKIQAAREAYEKLTQEQKALVDNYGVLAQAEATYENLRAADEVKKLIEAIGDVTYTKESAARIEAAKQAYEKLTQEQKAFVDNAGLLSSAEAAYEKLEAEHLKAEEERRKAEEARKEAERIAAEQEKARQEAERAAAEKARQEAAKKAEEEAKQKEIRNTKVKRASIKSAKRTKKNRAKITWKKLKGASGYELQYSTRKNFKKATKKKIGKNKTSYTLKKLKKNKKYYVRIRAYKTVHGVKVYGRYSKVKRLG